METVKEVRVEVNKNSRKQNAINTAKWGAFAFGLIFGFLSIVNVAYFYMGYFLDVSRANRTTVLDIIQWRLFDTFSFFLPILLFGIATAVIGKESNRKPLVFGLAGGLGYLFARWFGWGLIQSIFTSYGMPNPFTPLTFRSLFFTLITGAVFGAIVGVATKNKKQTFYLAIVGAVGFSLFGIGFGSSANSFWRMMQSSIEVFGSESTAFLVFSIPDLILDIIEGAILGAMLGWVLGWFSEEGVLKEAALIEGSAHLN